MKNIWHFTKLGFFILVSVFLILFIIHNTQFVNLSLFPLMPKIKMRLFLLVILCLIVGFVMGMILSAKKIFTLKIEKRSEVKSLEKELGKVKKDCKDK